MPLNPSRVLVTCACVFAAACGSSEEPVSGGPAEAGTGATTGGGGSVVTYPDGGRAGSAGSAVSDSSAGGGSAWDGPVIVGDGSIGAGGSPPAGAVVMTVDTTLYRTLPAAFHGFNYVPYWDDNQGSDGSAAGMRRIGMEITRFPGGVPGMLYSFYDPYKDGWAKTSPEQLWAWAQKIRPDETILFETNPTTGHGNDPSASRITDWVNDSKAKGINAKLWEVGNEPDMGEGNNGMTQTAYYAAFNQHATAIHAACPECKVLGPSTFTQLWNGNTWIADFIQSCDANVDAISIHTYLGEGWWGPGDKNAALEWTKHYDFIRTKTQKPIYVTEWTTNKSPGDYHLGGKVAGAIADADVLGSMCHSLGLDGHTYFGAVHVVWTNYGMFTSQDYGDTVVLTDKLDGNAATAPMMYLWASVMGKKVYTVNLPQASDGGPFDISTVNGWAHGRDDGSIQIMLINKQETMAPVRVAFQSFDPTGHKVNVHELRGLDGKAWDCTSANNKDCQHYFFNNVADAQLGDASKQGSALPDGGKEKVVTPGAVPPPTQVNCVAPNVNLSLPPLSITVLDFQP